MVVEFLALVPPLGTYSHMHKQAFFGYLWLHKSALERSSCAHAYAFVLAVQPVQFLC